MRRASLAVLGLLVAGPAQAAGVEPMVPPPRLDKGACAVSAWAQGETHGPLLVIAGQPPVARIQRDGRLKMLPRDGQPSGEGRQAFRGMGLRLELDVAIRPGLILQGEAAPQGVLTLTEADDASTMIPVTIRASCGG